ncbi:MAG: CRISPR-associated endonuclease Cas1 [Brevinematales bacterium]|nr:CRISPR-associated endonuclease Cas1 [Brevinematales bacterium]
MKHILITDYAEALRLDHGMLAVWQNGEKKLEYPLSKIKTITVCRNGVSLSSDLILQCAERGIKLFFLDFKGIQVAGVSPLNNHSISLVRKAQFKFIESKESREVAREFIIGKIHNQESVIKYFSKYINRVDENYKKKLINIYLTEIEKIINILKNIELDRDNWRDIILGIEGKAADSYWRTLRETNLLSSDFSQREGRGAKTISNQALNFGYSILLSIVWHCLVNSGLEIYEGILHTFRPGKPALVLDIMEEYRAWVVDRVIIKFRNFFEKKTELDKDCKELIIKEIHKTLGKKYPYHGKRVKLENIIQRQIYRLSGTFLGVKKYKSYLFRW